MIGKYVSYRNADDTLWYYGEILDFNFSQQDNTWLFFLASYSETGTCLAIKPFEEIRYEDMRKHNVTRSSLG